MIQKIIAFFMSIIMAIASLFGLGHKLDKNFKENLKYGSGERQVVDIAFPENPKSENGLILFIHGGAWIEGDKSPYRDTIRYVASIGYVGATMNYTYISEKSDILDIMDDVDLCLKAVKAEAKSRGFDLSKVILTGSSAGAHLSLLYAYSRRDTAPIKPVAVASNCGPTDLATYDENFIMHNAIGNHEYMLKLASYCCGKEVTLENYNEPDIQFALKTISPLYYVASGAVPTIIAHGKKDTIVPYAQAQRLDAALTQAGVTHQFVTFPNSGHSLADDKAESDLATQYLLQYIETYL